MQGSKVTFVNSSSLLLLLLLHHLMTTPAVFALLFDDLSITCSSSINDVTEALWDSDVNGLFDQYSLNLLTTASLSARGYPASARLFTYVDPAVLTRPTFKAFAALQDNYDPTPHADDRLSTSDANEADVFLDAVLQTKVMRTLLKFLMCRNVVHNEAGLRSVLWSLWFEPYSRSGHGSPDSSGFEHVMVGEFQTNTTVNGLHSWLAYYLKEQSGSIQYRGYVRTAEPNIIAVDYDWRGHHKSMGTFFLGTSPEFDMALYSLAILTNTSQVLLGDRIVRLQFYDLAHVNGLQVASAYPII